jgi:uncharacterized protein involved in exopolysaccharide biosynthesis
MSAPSPMTTRPMTPYDREIGPGADERLSVTALLAVLLRHLRLLVGIPLAFAFAVALFVLLQDRTYTAVVSFSPSSPQASLSQMAGLAAQFGVQLPGSAGAGSPEFYADLVRSTEFLKRVAETTFTRASDGARGSYAVLAEIEKSTAAKTLDATIRTLRQDVILVEPRLQTGVVRISVKTDWPDVSAQIASTLLTEIDAFNIRSHQQQAGADQRFAQERMQLANAELRKTEDQLQSFLNRNREFRSDPALFFEYERMQRDVAMRQSVYTMLSQTLEQARIEASRNTPSIRVIEQGEKPLVPDRRRLVVKTALALMVGLAVAFAAAFMAESLAREGISESDRATLRAALTRARFWQADHSKLV